MGCLGRCGTCLHFRHSPFPDKGPGTENLQLGPDFSDGCLTFDNGIVARITCGLSAPRDRSMTVMAKKVRLKIRDLWDNGSDIVMAGRWRTQHHSKSHRQGRSKALKKCCPSMAGRGSKIKYDRNKKLVLPRYPSQIDFMRGVAAQAAGIENKSAPFYSGSVAVHMSEIALALNAGEKDYKPETDFTFGGYSVPH